MGIREQIVFPIDYDKVDTLRGMDIAITTTANTDDEGRAAQSVQLSVPPELERKNRAMAKKSMINREHKRAKLSAKYAEKRASLKKASTIERELR